MKSVMSLGITPTLAASVAFVFGIPLFLLQLQGEPPQVSLRVFHWPTKPSIVSMKHVSALLHTCVEAVKPRLGMCTGGYGPGVLALVWHRGHACNDSFCNGICHGETVHGAPCAFNAV